MNSPPGLSFSDSIPYYWMYETSGKMKQIVQKYLDNQEMNEWELETFRWYVHQWVAAMPSKPGDYTKILIMSQAELTSYLKRDLLLVGIDPI